MVQDDRLFGLDGVQVKFDDERVVCDAGVMLVATLVEGSESSRWRSGWCVCGATGRVRPTQVARWWR